jgi:hypothetical protein
MLLRSRQLPFTAKFESIAEKLGWRSPPLSLASTAVPLCWAATGLRYPFANLGDALSPLIVSTLSGLPIRYQHFDATTERLACVGTIGHGLKNGIIHFWGTGVDCHKHPSDRTLNNYQRPPYTQFHVHALRGPLSAQTFRNQGIAAPEIYGDPVWFLPSIIEPASKKCYELGVIVHLSELTALTDSAGVKVNFLRYRIPESLTNQVKIISTLTQPNFEAIAAKVKEITSCRRILSTSLHGLVIAEAYRIPCAYFRTKSKGLASVDLNDENERMDQRMRDFYWGIGLQQLMVYGQPRPKETNWEKAIRAIDNCWTPIEWMSERFLETFPLPLSFNPLAGKVLGDRSLLQQIKF